MNKEQKIKAIEDAAIAYAKYIDENSLNQKGVDLTAIERALDAYEAAKADAQPWEMYNWEIYNGVATDRACYFIRLETTTEDQYERAKLHWHEIKTGAKIIEGSIIIRHEVKEGGAP